MFGVIVSGRLVQTDFQRVGETQFLFTIPDANAINHLVVFMTGAEPFPPEVAGSDDMSPHPFLPSQAVSLVAQVGISVEPLVQVALQKPVVKAAPVDTFAEFTSFMVESLFHYVASFAQTQAQMVPNPSETYVPIRTLQSWFNTFQRRLQQNPLFWRR